MALPEAPSIDPEAKPMEWRSAPFAEGLPPEHLLTSTAEAVRNTEPQLQENKFNTGPVKIIHAFWLAGMSCDGCTIAAAGATNPPIEALLTGGLPGLPKVILHHPVLSVEAGHEFVRNFELAVEGELNDPYVVIYEGSIADEAIAAQTGGYWAGLGVREGEDGPQPVPTAQWLREMAEGSAAVIAIGTCATWGGVPAAVGNPTGSMSVMDFLGPDFRSALGLPVVNIPGCSPIGDNFTETIVAVLLFLNGLGPLPEFDELGRPAWLFSQTVHQLCVRGGHYEEGSFAEHYGDEECLVEIGCWGPVVQCNITSRGAINHMGGCMNTGGICIGCTMPGFPDRFTPFYKKPPGVFLSSTASRTYSLVIRPLRQMTMQFQNRETHWGNKSEVSTGWGHLPTPSPISRVAHYFYEKMKSYGSGQKKRD
ncbi:MAG TPA: hypothetical protein VMN57_06920 [Anaerolineales bacterium]|nr:hypothetical protein [Anaerolineales bacterium]